MTGLLRVTMMLVLIVSISACGKDVDMTCDDVRAYQLAAPGKRVVAPDGLDNLDPLKESPLPEAAPQAERPPGSPCIDRPPKVQMSN